MRKLVLFVLALVISLPLAAEQKNVKQLTGLSDFELQRAMGEISASLGVTCDFCHMHKEHDWDFASDEKKEKVRAREMIAMTKGLNEGSFGCRSTIACFTCHRGKEHPVGLVLLPVAQAVPAGDEHHAEAAAQPNPTVEDLVKKYAAAVGDASRWSSIRAKGTRESADGKQTMPIELEASKGRYHVVAQSERGKMEQSAGATEGWVKSGPEPHAMTAAELTRFRDQAAAYEPVNPSDIPKEARVVGKDKIGDREVYAVFAVIGPKQRERLYFDAGTGLLVRRVILTDSPVGTIPQQTDYDDWRDVGGSRYPFLVKTYDPRNSVVRRYSEVALGVKIDEKVFEK